MKTMTIESSMNPKENLEKNTENTAGQESMRAIGFHRYGPPSGLALESVARPEPAAGEVLIKVEAASVNAGDWHLVRGEPFLIRMMSGLRRPKHTIPGSDVAGRVVAVGEGVNEFSAGDGVFGDLSFFSFGSFAEYVSVPADAVVKIPAGVSFEAAAAAPIAAVTALQALRDNGQLKQGQRVLVNGASGGVGHFAVQIAKAMGAHVTGVCSTRNLEAVKDLGADEVIDYTAEDPTLLDEEYDLVVDAAAFRSISDFKRVLNRGGRYVLVGGSMDQLWEAMLLGPLYGLTGGVKLGAMMARRERADLVRIGEWLATGVVKPWIDRTYPLEEVPAAIEHVEEGHARGKVVIKV